MNTSHETATVLQGLEKNPPFGSDPISVDIRGKHGMILYLDPRRVKPLPKQPRWKNNPGFSEESLRGLGRSIKFAGQVEAAKVCLTDDPRFDAQLYDGERRLQGCLLEGCMLKVGVREDISNGEALKVLSVVSNFGREGHTCLEIAHAISEFHSMKMTYHEIAGLFVRSEGWVHQHASLLKLDPEVQELLVATGGSVVVIDGEEVVSLEVSGKGRRKDTGILSFNLAITITDLPPEDQKVIAKHLVKHDLSLTQARRYILNYRQEKGQEKRTRRSSPKEQFGALQSLVGTTIDKFGIFEDMKANEFKALLGKQNLQELRILLKEVNGLTVTLEGFRSTISSLIPRV